MMIKPLRVLDSSEVQQEEQQKRPAEFMQCGEVWGG